MIQETAELRLVPVTCREERAGIFQRMREEGRAQIVQYSLPEPDLAVWLEGTAPGRAWFCILSMDISSSGASLPSGKEGEFFATGVYSSGTRPEQKAKPDEASRQAVPAAAVWISDFCGKTAFAHFVVFRGFTHLSTTLCHLASQWAFDGGLACLLGLIPAGNRAALAAMRASGWQEIFRIPQACYLHRLGRHVDGVLCHFTPKLLHEAMP